MVDEDDVEAIAFEQAMRQLVAVSAGLADPEAGLVAWLDMVVAVLLHQQSPGRPLSWVLTACAKRTIVDIRLAL